MEVFLDGHMEQLGLQLGGSREPLKVFEQGRGAVEAAVLKTAMATTWRID